MKRIGLRLGITFLGIVLIAAVVIAVLNAVVLTPERVERRLSSLFGREVAIDGDVEFSLWGEARLTLRGVRLDNPPNSGVQAPLDPGFDFGGSALVGPSCGLL